jgi:hypothetical protein
VQRMFSLKAVDSGRVVEATFSTTALLEVTI